MQGYIRTPRAAVAASSAESDPAEPTRRSSALIRQPVQILWASGPLSIPAGRVVAVRLRGDDLQVAIAERNGMRWVPPAAVMTTAQAERWTTTSTFAPEHERGRRRPRA